MKRKVAWGVTVAAALAAAGAMAYARLRGRREMPLDDSFGADGVVDSEVEPSQTRERDRRPGDEGYEATRRGSGGLALDVERLKADPEFTPAVEYLTYIQVQRGVQEHLLFVRDQDVEAIAALEGQAVPEFVERLQRLGVIISRN